MEINRKCLNCNDKKIIYIKKDDSYKCLNCNYEYKKQYFFVSHSHLDIEKVRIIRNIIEETFFYEPILFFLKCLSDDNEIQDLIQREISERIWFIYCDSINARNSLYVKKEREFVEQLIKNGKKINVVNIELDKFEIWDDACYEYIRKQINYHIFKSKIFISYKRMDTPFVKRLHNSLSSLGFSVFDNVENSFDISWFDNVKSYIKNHSYKDGIFLLVSQYNNDPDNFVKMELESALKNNALVVHIYLNENSSKLNPLVKYFKFNIDDYDNEIIRLDKFFKSL